MPPRHLVAYGEPASREPNLEFLNPSAIPQWGWSDTSGLRGSVDLTRQRRSGLVAALACASLLAVTHCMAAKSVATQGETNSSPGAMAKVAAKAAKPGAKKAASA